jgi:UDPglucose--hexose-1-phosphate uridylyltransferase
MTSPSELRKDHFTGRWVIIAAERNKRPDDFRPPKPEKKEGPPVFCPFCTGNESKTPPEVFAIRPDGKEPDTPGWQVRVVPNKFPALTRGHSPQRKVRGVYECMDGIGVHEVIIESPDHDRELGDLPASQVRDIFWTYQQRIRSIESEAQYQYVQLFKNKGRAAGASLSHPHSQIVATPIIPKRIKEEIYNAERFFKKNRECIFCRTLQEDRADGQRLVASNAHFVVTAPFASRFPFELRVLPLRHSPHFGTVREEELQAFAEIMRIVIGRLKEVLADPPYNILLHQAPTPNHALKVWPQIDAICHWHLEVIPVLTRVAGFEWGTGFYINPVQPEAAAKFLRA